MRIINLVENTEGPAHLPVQHGLSFYIETPRHKILVDTGASDLFAQNAEALGVDLTLVDTVVLSHGHYDHGGGLKAFLELNHTAAVYMQESAFGDYYSRRDPQSEPHYIGIDSAIKDSPQLKLLKGNHRIDEELFIFSNIPDVTPVPSTNRTILMKKDGDYVRDSFTHEQCLVICSEGRTVLFSGCAHHGIINMVEEFRSLYCCDPDLVISGFHLLRKQGYSGEDYTEMKDIARALSGYNTLFYTCHCTGEEPYKVMKEIMGNKLSYIHCGDEL